MRIDSKLFVAISSLIISIFLMILRIIAYLYSGSLVVLTDLLDTSIDILAGSIAAYSIYIASKPPDRDHRYGHGKAEDIGGLIESIILIGAFIFILANAIDRIFRREYIYVSFTLPVIIIISSTLIINLWRSIVLRRVALREHSKALEADYLHYLSDVFSSSTVLIVGFLGFSRIITGDLLIIIDSLSAVAISLYFVSSGIKLGSRAISDLMDRTPEIIAGFVDDLVSRDPRFRVVRVRARRSGKIIFIDLSLRVSPHLDLTALKRITADIEDKIRKRFPDIVIDMVYNFIPEDNEFIAKKIRDIVSKYRGVDNVHNIIYIPTEKGGELRLHIEIDPKMNVDEAHRIISNIENDIYRDVEDITKVVIHAEPRRGLIDYNRLIYESINRDHELRSNIRISSISSTVVGDRIFLDIVCRVPPHLDMEKAHSIISKFEGILREVLGDNVAVTIHIEPDEAT